MTEKKHTNNLINETSPYLLQHAHNPVDWYPWGEEAFAKRAARTSQFSSIGYSACHWCHVMEHESFENEAIAEADERQLREHQSRSRRTAGHRSDLHERRADDDRAGRLADDVFLTPDGEPFYGGTYFPPEDRYTCRRFRDVLMSMADAYRAQPDRFAIRPRQMLRRTQARQHWPSSTKIAQRECSTLAYRRIAGQTTTASTAVLAARQSSRRSMTLEFLLHTFHRTGAAGAARSSSNVDARWRPAACTINSAAAFIAIRSMRDGWCRISKKCCTTMRCWRSFYFQLIK